MGETQMRRMLKEAEYAGARAGGPLSKLHAAAGPGARTSAVRIQHYGAGLDYRHLRNNLSRSRETFSRHAARLA